MPIESKTQGYTLYHHCIDIISLTDFQQYLRTTKSHYQKVGDAMALINDVRQLRRVSLSALHYISTTMPQLHLPVFPAAFIGKTDSLLFNLAMSISKLSSGTKQMAFLDSFEQAEAWLEAWFENQYHGGRESVVGHVNPLGYTKKQKEVV